MPENRKYLLEEITYVLSRVLAGWKHEAIAEAFKRDHAPYWDRKEFTKKQVSYIRNTYKIPPGSIEPYQEPEPELQQQSIAAISPLTRLLMMDHPTPQHNDVVAGGHDVHKDHLEGEEALLDWSKNNTKIQSESVSHQNHQPGFYNAAAANTGFTTAAPQSFGTQANDCFELNACNGPATFNNGGFDAGGMGSTHMNHHPDVNANEGFQGKGGNLFDQTIHGIGEQSSSNNASTSDDSGLVLSAEDQAFLEEMFPSMRNEQQTTNTNNVQAVASARQGLSIPTTSAYQPQSDQLQAQEDTVMHSVESEIVDLTDDGEAQAIVATTSAGPERPMQRPEQQLAPHLSNLPTTVCKIPSLMNAEAIQAFRRRGSSRVVDFYFGPHGNCPVPREHGHNSIDGSIVFRSEVKLLESFAAMQDKEGASYRLGLADGIDQGLQSVMNLANSAFHNNDVQNNFPPAVAAAAAQTQTQTPAFDQMYHRARGINQLNAIGVLGSQVTHRPAGIAPGKSRPAAWWRAQNNEYGDAYTGGSSNLDYQHMPLGNHRATQAQGDDGGEGSNFGGAGAGDIALRHRQNQQSLLQHSSPSEDGGNFDLYIGDQDNMSSRVFRPYHPQGMAAPPPPANPHHHHHNLAYHSPAHGVPSNPTDYGGLVVANSGTHTSGFGIGYSNNNNSSSANNNNNASSFGQNGGGGVAFGGPPPSPGMTHPQHEAPQAHNYQSSGFYQQHQHGGPVPDVYTPHKAGIQSQRCQKGARRD